MAVDEEKCEATRFGQAVLDLRPGGWRICAVFLRIQGNGGLSRHLSRGPLWFLDKPAFPANHSKYRFQICDLQRVSCWSRQN